MQKLLENFVRLVAKARTIFVSDSLSAVSVVFSVISSGFS